MDIIYDPPGEVLDIPLDPGVVIQVPAEPEVKNDDVDVEKAAGPQKQYKVHLSKTSLRVVEGGACDFYSVCLSDPPNTDVMVQIDDPSGQIRAAPKVVQFLAEKNDKKGEPGHWGTPVRVRIMAIDDDTMEGCLSVVNLAHCSLSGDLRFSSVSGNCLIEPPVVTVNIFDNDGGYIYTFGEIHSGEYFSVPVIQDLRSYERQQQQQQQQQQLQQLRPKQSFMHRHSDVNLVDEMGVHSVGCGANHIAIALSDGRVFTLGLGDDGQLANGKYQVQREFCLWKSIDFDGVLRSKITQVSCGLAHTALVTDDGRLLMCGSNTLGQLGACPGLSGDCECCKKYRGGESILAMEGGKKKKKKAEVLKCATPRLVEALSHLFVERVSCGDYHTIALANTATSHSDQNVVKCLAFGWGDASSGALGQGISKLQPHPVEITEISNKDPFQVECGSRHTAILCGPGELYTAGLSVNGCIGRVAKPDDPTLNHFVQITTRHKLNEAFVYVASGSNHIAVFTEKRNVYTCGANECGQLGLGDKQFRTRLTRIDFLDGLAVSDISLGMLHSCCTTQTGDLYVWGANDNGQLGIGGKVICQTIPYLHKYMLTGQVKQIRMGKAFTSVVLGKALSNDEESIEQAKAKREEYNARVGRYWEARRVMMGQKLRNGPKIQQLNRDRLKKNRAVVDPTLVRKIATHFPFQTVAQFKPRTIKRPPRSRKKSVFTSNGRKLLQNVSPAQLEGVDAQKSPKPRVLPASPLDSSKLATGTRADVTPKKKKRSKPKRKNRPQKPLDINADSSQLVGIIKSDRGDQIFTKVLF